MSLTLVAFKTVTMYITPTSTPTSFTLLKEDHINDIVIPTIDEKLGDKHKGRHFQIAFNRTTLSYFIKDLGKGFGAFYKINAPQVPLHNRS